MSNEEKRKVEKMVEYILIGYNLAYEHLKRYGQIAKIGKDKELDGVQSARNKNDV
jgi:hypothetical protein